MFKLPPNPRPPSIITAPVLVLVDCVKLVKWKVSVKIPPIVPLTVPVVRTSAPAT